MKNILFSLLLGLLLTHINAQNVKSENKVMEWWHGIRFEIFILCGGSFVCKGMYNEYLKHQLGDVKWLIIRCAIPATKYRSHVQTWNHPSGFIDPRRMKEERLNLDFAFSDQYIM